MKINIHQLKSPITLISLLSIIGGLSYIFFPFIVQYGISIYPVSLQTRILQFSLYSIIHGGFLHILSNVIFFLFIGRIIELTHGAKYVWGLWIWTTLFVGGVLMLLATGPTIGGSGFAMALLSVYTLDFYKRGNSDYKGGLLLIFINIGIGFYGNISLLGHLAGAMAGFLYGIALKKK